MGGQTSGIASFQSTLQDCANTPFHLKHWCWKLTYWWEGTPRQRKLKCILSFNAFYCQHNWISSLAFSSHWAQWVPGLSSGANTPEYSIPCWGKSHGVKTGVVRVWTEGHQSCSVSAWRRIWFPISKWCNWGSGCLCLVPLGAPECPLCSTVASSSWLPTLESPFHSDH